MREKKSYLTFPGRLNREGNSTRSEREMMRKGKKKRIEKLERSGQRDLKQRPSVEEKQAELVNIAFWPKPRTIP